MFPMQTNKENHCKSSKPVNNFYHVSGFYNDSVFFQMKDYSCHQCNCKHYQQCNACVGLYFRIIHIGWMLIIYINRSSDINVYI